MTKKNIIESVKNELIEKGIPKSLIVVKSEQKDWKNKILEIERYRINELEQFDLFVINDSGFLCECYIFVEEYETEKPYHLTEILKDSLIEVFEVECYEDDEIDYWISYISEKELTVGQYLMLIEQMTELHHSKFVFRGQCSRDYCLIPSIYRLSSDKKHRYVESEIEIFKEAIRTAPKDYPVTMSNFEKLVKMQHYSLPTRLLDVTYSSLVALYFAVNSSQKKDGEVIIFKVNKKDQIDYDDMKVSEMTKYLDGKSEKKDDVLFVKPLMDNPRIKAQGGVFLLFGENREKECSANKYYYRRIIIPKKSKKILAKELKKLLIDDSTMYQDLDHTMKNVRSQFLNLP